jgi:hypothetical protein
MPVTTEKAAGTTAAAVSALDRTSSRAGELTRDEVLDNITLYWLTNTGVSASEPELFSEEIRAGFRPLRETAAAS